MKVRISYEFEIESSSDALLDQFIEELLDEPVFEVNGVTALHTKGVRYSITLVRGTGRREAL